MIEEKVSEVVAVGINARLLAEAGGAKERERLQRSKGCLALGHRCGTAGHCNRQRRQFSFVANPLEHVEYYHPLSQLPLIKA